jgi:hypothetical protein
MSAIHYNGKNVKVPSKVSFARIPTSGHCFATCSSRKENFQRVCQKNIGKGFRILIKEQITEPVRKLRDKFNDTN